MLPKIIKPCGTNNQTMCPFTDSNQLSEEFREEQAESEGLFFGRNEVSEKKNCRLI